MGTLYLVATPIGNLEDITLRALRVLREVSLIAAEDTRHTRKLLNHFDLPTRAISYHEHSPPSRLAYLVDALATGDLALVTDAGTPAISDPGEDLVRAALVAGHAVVSIPGPTALVAALVASGLPSATFTFLGFLPRKAAERRALLARVRADPRTLIFYEAPHRLLDTLDDLRAALGDRPTAVARELTKLHEQWYRGPLSAVRDACAASPGPRGEYVLVVAGASSVEASEAISTSQDARDIEAQAADRLRALLASGRGTRQAAAEVAAELGLPRRVAYALALRLGEHPTPE